MILKYLKIWLFVVKKGTSKKTAIMDMIKFLVCFLSFYIITFFNLTLSLFLVVTFFTIISIYRIYILYKDLLKNENFNLLCLKPLDPLFGLLIYDNNFGDILILLPILIFIKFKNKNEK